MTNKKIGKYRWTICSLIFFATTINYLDRQVISILKGTLQDELSFGEATYGYIVFCFQLSYAIGMVLAGRIIDKLGTKIGYALSLIGWSIAAIAHAFARGPIGFGVFRAFLGISEAGNFPAAIKATAEWFPKKERALATGLFNSGANVGAILAPLTVPFIAIRWGWEWAFILTGAVGFIWLIFWFRYYEIPRKQNRLSKEELEYIESDNEPESSEKIPWATLFKYKQTWAIITARFLTDPIWWFLLFWIPGWLEDVKGVDIKNNNYWISLAVIYSFSTVGSILGGWISSYLINKGWAVYKARLTSMLLFAFLVMPIVFVQFDNVGFWGAIAFISMATASHQAWSANMFTIISDVFPKKAVASVTGIGGMVGAIGGMIIAIVAGNLLEFYSNLGNIDIGYFILFMIAGFMYFVAWLLIKAIAPKLKRLDL